MPKKKNVTSLRQYSDEFKAEAVRMLGGPYFSISLFQSKSWVASISPPISPLANLRVVMP